MPKTLTNRIKENEEAINKMQPVILFSGEGSGNITLSDSISNYHYLEIYYHNNDGYHGCQKILSSFNNFFLLSVMATKGTLYIKPTIYTISGTSITMAGNGECSIDTNIVSWKAGENRNTIDKVLGYK